MDYDNYDIICSDATNGYGKPKKGYFCKIEGRHPQFKWTRSFFEPEHTESRHRYFNFPSEDGVFEAVTYSAKGNKTTTLFHIINGERAEITLESLDAIFPEKVEMKEVIPDNAIKTQPSQKYLGKVGDVVEYQGSQHKIVKVEQEDYWEDIDGISGKYPSRPHEPIAFTWSEYTFYLVLANESEILEKQSQDELAKDKEQALKEANALVSGDSAIYPDSSGFPSGEKIILQKGHYQDNVFLVVDRVGEKLWKMIYNGRDGDDWSQNNIDGAYIGCYVLLTPELSQKIEKIQLILNR